MFKILFSTVPLVILMTEHCNVTSELRLSLHAGLPSVYFRTCCDAWPGMGCCKRLVVYRRSRRLRHPSCSFLNRKCC